MRERPFVALGNFWRPVIGCVREVEAPPGHLRGSGKWLESNGCVIHVAKDPASAADYLGKKLT